MKNFFKISNEEEMNRTEQNRTEQNRKFKLKGFTLVELLVVVVVIGILATISVPVYNGYQEKARVAKMQAFAAQTDKVLLAETVLTGQGSAAISYNFDEGSGTKITDSSGSGNNTTTPSSGFVWSSDTIDNSSHSAQISRYFWTNNNVQNMPKDEITFSTFVKITGWESLGYTYPLFINCNSGFQLYKNGYATFYINSGGGFPGNYLSKPNLIKTNQWHHLLGTYAHGKMRFFVDGNLVAEANNIPLNLPFNMGGCSVPPIEQPQIYFGYFGAANFIGHLDRVRVYPVGLNPENL